MDIGRVASGRFQKVEAVAVTGSTNTDLVESARRSPTVPRVRFADVQTDGRGRRDRRWEMRAGDGLLVSFYVPWNSAESAHLVPTALGLAAVDAVSTIGPEIRLKWPNDLVSVDDHKVGGMLSEVVSVDGAFAGVVAGLGCNVHWPRVEDEPVPGLENAISLDTLAGRRLDETALAVALVASFDEQLNAVRDGTIAAVHDRWRAHCSTIGRTVRIDTGGGSFVGEATDVSPDGALIVLVDGVQRRVDVGDVVHLRPAPG